MKTWNVYIDGVWKGTVFGHDEQEARNAAISTYDPPLEASISVSQR